MPSKTKEHQPNEVLSLREDAKNQLLQIKTVEEGITYLNKLKSIEVWVQAEKKDAELQNLIAEQKLRTQRTLGELIKETQRKGLLASQSHHGKGIQTSVPDGNTRTLDEYGLTRKQSATFQAIADIPEKDFEEFIEVKKKAVTDAVAELTTAGALRLAKSLCQQENNSQDSHAVDLQIDRDQEIKDLAKYINQHFTKEQKANLITLIFPH